MINRRILLAALGIGSLTGTGWLRWAQAAAAAEGEADASGQALPTRAFGRADERVTLACFGGWHLSRFYDDAGAERIVRAAIDAGIRFFDTAESYGPHESERMYGRHLTPRSRDHVFLMSKTMARDAATARQHLDDSLARLRTDRLDLWQMHAIDTPGDVDARIDAGVLDVLLEAKAAGRVRYVGFTGHKSYLAHARMLDRLADLGLEMDALQMPVNVLDPGYASFIRHVLPTAVRRGYAVLAMKTLANGRLTDKGEIGRREPIIPAQLTIAEALGFAWSLPIASLVLGVDTIEQLHENCAVARQAPALTEADRLALTQRVAAFAGREREYYKS